MTPRQRRIGDHIEEDTKKIIPRQRYVGDCIEEISRQWYQNNDTETKTCSKLYKRRHRDDDIIEEDAHIGEWVLVQLQ